MLFPSTPDDDAPELQWRAWLRYLRTLPDCSPSVTIAIAYAAKVLQERQMESRAPPPLTASETGLDARGG